MPIFSTNAARFRVIAYTYEFDTPLNLTPYVTSVQSSATLDSSTKDQATIAVLGVDPPKWLTVGDWIQIDLIDLDGSVEHVFFGPLRSITAAADVIGSGGGTAISNSLTVDTWANVFHAWRKDTKAFLQLRARDVVEGAPGIATAFPTLAAIAADVEGAIWAPPWVHVSLLMEVLARYGGTMRQPFDMPASFTPDEGGAISLLSMICKLNQRRKDSAGSPLTPADQINGGLFATDLPNHNVAALAALANRADEAWAKSVWALTDWHATFEALPEYPVANAVLDEIMQIDGEGDLWSAMMEYSDAGWTQLYCALVESIDYNGSARTYTAHDGTEFTRSFLLAVSLHPVPHPTYRGGPTDIVTDERGYSAVPADSEGYDRRPKVVIHVGALESSGLTRSLDNHHNYWSILPQDSAFKGIAQYDAAWVGRLSSWRFPIVDTESIRVYGYLPLEMDTKYWMRPDGSEFWPLLARKTALQYAWTVHGCNEITGTISIPLTRANIPRPADVLLLVGSRDSPSVVFAQGAGTPARDDAVAASATSAVLDAHPAGGSGALSGYVEAVHLQMSVDEQSGAVAGSVSIQISHGHTADVPNGVEAVSNAGGYRRVAQLSEIGLTATWWLPYQWGIDIFLRLTNLPAGTQDATLPARTAAAAQSYAPVVRERSPQRASPPRAVRPPTALTAPQAPPPPVGPPLAWIGPVFEPRVDKPRPPSKKPKKASAFVHSYYDYIDSGKPGGRFR